MTFALGAGGLLALYYSLRFVSAPVDDFRSAVKSGATLSLATAGMLAEAPLLIVWGLILSTLGDWALSRDGPLAMAMGILFFGAAQTFYIWLFWGAGLGTVAPFVIGFVAIGMGLLLPRDMGLILRGMVVLYTGLLLSMAYLAYSTGNSWLMGGAILFVLSDALIGLELLGLQGTAARVVSHAVWLTYWPAQLCLLVGVWPG